LFSKLLVLYLTGTFICISSNHGASQKSPARFIDIANRTLIAIIGA
jgi:hypothetical protein